MTSLTLVTLALICYGTLSSPGYGRALALGGATPAGAAFALSSTVVIPTFYAVALGVMVALGLQLLGGGSGLPRKRRHLAPGAPLLILFLLWASFATVFAPVIFPGLQILATSGAREALVPGTLNTSNTAQLIYLFIAVCVVVFLGRSPHARPELIGLAAGLVIVLSLWRYLYQNVGVPFPEGFFDNSPIFNYIETAAGGLKRFRGILSEPAAFAVCCLVAIGYMLPRSAHVHGWRRVGALFIVAAAAYMGVISTSGTFVIAGILIAVIAALTFLFRFVVARTSLGALPSVVACVLVIAGLWLLPIVVDFVQSTVNEKVSSSSYDDRSGSDSIAYQNFYDTFGLGVGVGSTRASSFFPGILAATGIIGTLLLAATIVILIRKGARVPEYRPVIWAFVCALVVKLVSSPDLSDTSGIFWMSLGLLSRAALIADRQRAAPPVEPAEPGRIAHPLPIGELQS